MKKIKLFFITVFTLLSFYSFSQWACYPMGQGASMVCGWACYSGHQGQDWQYTPNNTSYGQNIYAVDDGVVTALVTGYTGCDDPFIAGGLDWAQPTNLIIVYHSSVNLYTRYLHIKDAIPGLAVGSTVYKGDVIAYIGNVGPISPCNNTNPNINAHLHFEIGTGQSGNSLTGRYDPINDFTGCYPPFCCTSTSLNNTNCSGTFEDTGGSNATYSNYENYTFTIAPPSAAAVSVNFWWLDVENGYDYLYAYDGPNTSSPLIGAYTGTSIPSNITSTGGAITFKFISDVSILGQGWSASWSCTSAAPQSLNAAASSCPHIDFNLSWLNSGANWFVDISDVSNFSYFWNQAVPNLTSIISPNNFQHISIPGNYLSFQPLKTYYWRVWNGTAHTYGNNFTIPWCVNTDANCSGTYDDTGGSSAIYTSNEDYTKVIQPLNAASVTMNFSSFDIEQNYDSMWIYNGSVASGTLIGVYTGTVSPGTVTASSGTMTLRFKSDSYVENSGWTANWNCTLLSTGITANTINNNLSVYPNPFSNELNLKYSLEGDYLNSLVQLIEVGSGRIIQQKNITERSGIIKFDTEGLASSLYMLCIKQNSKPDTYIKVVSLK